MVPLGTLNLWLVQKQALYCWLVVGDGDGMVGHLNLVPGRKALSSSSLGPQLPRKLSPRLCLATVFVSFLSGLGVTYPKLTLSSGALPVLPLHGLGDPTTLNPEFWSPSSPAAASTGSPGVVARDTEPRVPNFP